MRFFVSSHMFSSLVYYPLKVHFLVSYSMIICGWPRHPHTSVGGEGTGREAPSPLTADPGPRRPMAQASSGGRRAHWTNSGPVADGPAAGTNDWRDWGTYGRRARTDVWRARTDVWRVSIRADSGRVGWQLTHGTGVLTWSTATPDSGYLMKGVFVC